jgi:hypothetical protein
MEIAATSGAIRAGRPKTLTGGLQIQAVIEIQLLDDGRCWERLGTHN